MAKQESPFPPKTDFLEKHGAGLLVEHILAYWQKRGFLAVRVERYQLESGAWGVRSNLVGGLPPHRRR